MNEQALFDQNQGLAYMVFHCYKHRFPNFYHEDLQKECLLALWKACKTFDLSRGLRFSTYASTVISNHLKILFRDNKKHWIHKIESLDAPVFLDEDSKPITWGDRIEKPYSYEAYMDVKELMQHPMVRLKAAGYSNREIADQYGISQAYVSRIINKVRKKLIV